MIKQSPAAKETIDLKFSSVLFTAEGDALETLEPSDALLDARAGPVESVCEEGRLVLFVGLARDDGSDAARSRGIVVGLTGVAFVADGGAGLNVGSDIEQVSK